MTSSPFFTIIITMITHFINHKRFLKTRTEFFELRTVITDDSNSHTVFTTGQEIQDQDESEVIPKYSVEVSVKDMENMIDILKMHIKQIKKQNEKN